MIAHLLALVLSLDPSALPVRFSSNYDGDTIRMSTAYEGYTLPLEIRVENIDTPEIRGKCQTEIDLAIRARDEARRMLRSGKVGFSMVERRPDQYDRILARVTVDGKDLGEHLVSQGLARRWTGRRLPWCAP